MQSGLAEEILDHLVTSGMLFDDGYGILSMGAGGEKSYGYRHFLDLTSAFTSNPLFVVRHGSKEIGYLDPIALLTHDRHFATVLLAGRSWKVTSIDWDRHFAWVEPIGGRRPVPLARRRSAAVGGAVRRHPQCARRRRPGRRDS